ncbi:MAG: polysaccharide deacetylase family protein [Ferruginibacter sp.]|nr:polysaccharide deacetylase family protein [Ferruginibacter sp.]
MLLIYSHTSSARLQYICSFIFEEQMGIEYKLTIDSEAFKNYAGVKINYSDARITADEFYIQNHSLLFESDIREQVINCFIANGHKAFFKTSGSDFPFDTFAASFYLLSRYEEYLPHKKDTYDRYAHENSLAYKEGFLHFPLINLWMIDFAEKLKEKSPAGSLHSMTNFQPHPERSRRATFSFKPTYDIDIAYSYKHKGLLRNAGGFLRSPSLERMKVLAGSQEDPFDCYDWLNNLHKKYNLTPVYFFLVAEKNGEFDKNILPHKDVMWQLVKKHASLYEVGIHPSWQSNEGLFVLKKELEWLAEMSGIKHVTVSRQHYIKLALPQTYRTLIEAGIMDDDSMGYGSINGFRASVASSFYWYDLEKETKTTLRIHPFCFMDANCYYEQKQNAEQAFEELMHYYTVCKNVNGTFVTIFHNHFLGTAKEFEGWSEMYERFIAQVQQ